MRLNGFQAAQKYNINRSSITRWKQKKLLIVDGDGYFEESDFLKLFKNMRGKKVKATTKEKKVKSKKKTGKNDRLPEIRGLRPEEPINIKQGSELYDLSRDQLARMKLAEEVEQKRVKNTADRGSLIPRKLVKEFISELYTIDVNEFLQLSPALSARICEGVFETSDADKMTQVSKMIDTELYKTQGHIQSKVDKFIKTITPKKKKEKIA